MSHPSPSAADKTTAEPAPAADDAPGSHLIVQLRVLGGLSAAAVIFWTIGWTVIQPFDPLGPISLLGMQRPVPTMGALALVGLVTGALTAAVAGRAASLMSPLGTAVGLAALNWRGAQSDKIGAYLARSGDAGPVWPTYQLILELWLWIGIIALAIPVGRWCAGRLCPRDPREPMETPPGGTTQTDQPTGMGVRMFPALVVGCLLAYVLMLVFSGSDVSGVFKQQIYFAVGTSFLISSMAGQLLFRPAVSWWPLVGAAVLGAVAYLSGEPPVDGDTAYVAWRILPDVLARPLPIEYAALGAVGGLLGVRAGRALEATDLRGALSA